MTPEQRAAIEGQIAELTARMDKLDPLCHHAHIPESRALYEVRDLLEKQLPENS